MLVERIRAKGCENRWRAQARAGTLFYTMGRSRSEVIKTLESFMARIIKDARKGA